MRIYDSSKLVEINIINCETQVNDTVDIVIDGWFKWNEDLQAYKVKDTECVIEYMAEFASENGGDDVWCTSYINLLTADMEKIEKLVKAIDMTDDWEAGYIELAEELGMTAEWEQSETVEDFDEAVFREYGFLY